MTATPICPTALLLSALILGAAGCGSQFDSGQRDQVKTAAQPAAPTAAVPAAVPTVPATLWPATGAPDGPAVRLAAINVGEAVFEPFFDPQLSGLAGWSVAATGATVKQEWCWVEAVWARVPASGPTVRLERRYDLDLARYAGVVAGIAAPVGSRIVIELRTEAGPRRSQFTVARSEVDEYVVPLAGGQRLQGMAIEVQATAAGSVRLLWLGASDPALVAAERARWQELARQPLDPYLVPASQEPCFQPAYGLLLDAAGFERLRTSVADHRTRYGRDPFDPARFASLGPAGYVGDCSATDHGLVGRFGRVADRDRPSLQVADAAFAAVVQRDAGLLRRAMSAALALAQVPWWDSTPFSRMPGTSWDVRPFSNAMVAWDLAMAMDLGGDLLTPVGRDLILRRLAEDGLGTLNFTAWRWDYIYLNNQLLAFTRGRIPAYLVLEKHWKRVAPYTDLAMAEVREAFANNFLPDGGFREGPGYFNYTLNQVLPAITAYARMRGKDAAQIVPRELLASTRYAAVLATTDRAGGFIPLCNINDGRSSHFAPYPEVLAQLAVLFPDSPWRRLHEQNVAALGTNMPGSALAWIRPAPAVTAAVADEPLVALPDLGLVASHRRLGAEQVKLLIVGGLAHAGHNHEDKGSFVLEFAGDTFACEPGGWSYDQALSALQREAQRHNMLIPTGCTARPAPRNPLPVPILPVAKGDTQAFTANLAAGLAWPDHFVRWNRSFASPDPGHLEIRDEWELRQGDGVDFTWVTRLPLRISGQVVEVRGQRGLARITAPSGTTLSSADLPLQVGVLHALRIHQAGKSGSLSIAVELVPLP